MVASVGRASSTLFTRAFEMLSLIAHRQPITRGEIEEANCGVKPSNIMKSLLEREWVKVVDIEMCLESRNGRLPESSDHFKLKTLDQLPPWPMKWT